MELSYFKDYGLLGLIMGSVVALLFFVIKWTLATTRDILSQAARERESWQKAVERMSEAWTAHTAQALQFHEMVTEAHKFQREEHLRMLDNQNIVSASLKQVEQALGRINGYSHNKD